MTRPAVPLLAVLALSAILAPVAATPAAAEPSFTQRVAIWRACKPDLDRHCPDAGTNGARVSACLRANRNALGQGCLGAIRAAGIRE